VATPSGKIRLLSVRIAQAAHVPYMAKNRGPARDHSLSGQDAGPIPQAVSPGSRSPPRKNRRKHHRNGFELKKFCHSRTKARSTKRSSEARR